jgi:O-antigen ligase
MITVLLSILGNFTGVYRGMGSGQTFKGLTYHSMMLGPLAAITFLNAFWAITRKNAHLKWFFIVAIALSFLTMIYSGSRGALFGGLLAVLIYFIKLYQNRLGKSFAYIITLVVLIASTYSVWGAFTGDLEKKMENSQKHGDLFVSRSQLWAFRMQEFNESPLIGIGFASAKYGPVDKTNGVIEPGSSWGAILAQLGLIGFIPFLILILYYLWLLIKDKRSPNHSAYLLALLMFFMVHWFVEGYILAAGAFLCLYSWLVLGVIDIYKKGIKFDFI